MQRGHGVLMVAGLFIYLGSLFLTEIPVFAADGDPFSGNKLYLTYCLPCHGEHGKGDGVIADVLQRKPRDLTDDAFMSSRTDQQLVAAIGKRISPHGQLAMPDWQGILTAQHIEDLVAYVRTLHRQPALAGSPTRGAALFTRYCWTCHGPAGQGDGAFAPLYDPEVRDLSDPRFMASRTDNELYASISLGTVSMAKVRAMPAWGQVLTPQEIWDLIAYLRHLSR